MKRFQDRIIQMEQTTGACLLAGLFLIINIGILARYVFGLPIFWIEEASNFLFIWFGFLACSTALAQRRHILIDFFTHALPQRVQSVIHLIMGLLLQFLFLSMLLPSIKAFKEFQISSALRIPEGYIFLIVPLAFILFSFHNLLGIFSDIRRLRTASKAGEGGH